MNAFRTIIEGNPLLLQQTDAVPDLASLPLLDGLHDMIGTGRLAAPLCMSPLPPVAWTSSASLFSAAQTWLTKEPRDLA